MRKGECLQSLYTLYIHTIIMSCRVLYQCMLTFWICYREMTTHSCNHTTVVYSCLSTWKGGHGLGPDFCLWVGIPK